MRPEHNSANPTDDDGSRERGARADAARVRGEGLGQASQRENDAIAAVRTSGGDSQDLQHVLKIIASSTDARRELVADIRGRVASGDYVTEEKLNLAIYRLLKDILD